MNRQLKKMIRECRELEQKWYNMAVDNSTDAERKDAWLDILCKRREVAYKCAEILGVKDEDDARVICSSVERGRMFHYLQESNYARSLDKQGLQ